MPAQVCILNHEIREEYTDLFFTNNKFRENFGEVKNFDEIKKKFYKI
jgi:hypothetical protein